MRVSRMLIIVASVLTAVLLRAGAPERAALGTVTTLYTFSNGYDGGGPETPVTVGSGGVLYGTTSFGGEYGTGVAYSLTPPTSPSGSWTQTILYEFGGLPGSTNGSGPTSNLLIDSNGVLFGTTAGGGSSQAGTVFSLAPPASLGGAWTYETLYSFTGQFTGRGDGYGPGGNIVFGAGGVLYGTTGAGGASGSGAVYSLTPPTSHGGIWQESLLYSFQGNGDGVTPSGLAIGKDGVLYGTTSVGGASFGGTVFSLMPPAAPGGSWTKQILFGFDGADGEYPTGGLAVSNNGVLYGTTTNGYSNTCLGGVVFSLTPPVVNGGTWTESTLYCFTGIVTQGSYPYGGAPYGTPLITPDGSLYGTTSKGGGHQGYAYGTIFKLVPPSSAGSAWTLHTLYTFPRKLGAVQITPYAGLVPGPDGLLYGTTTGFNRGPTQSQGTVFSFKP